MFNQFKRQKLVKRHLTVSMSDYYERSESDTNFLSSTLNAVVAGYLNNNSVMTIKIQVLGKIGVGKTSLISNYV